MCAFTLFGWNYFDWKLHLPEPKHKIKSPNRLQKCESVDLPSTKSHVNSYAKQARINFEENEAAGYDASCFSPRSLFVSPLDRSSVTLDSLQFLDDSSDQDLLLDVPSNVSLQQAELLDCNFWKQKSSLTRSSTETHDKQERQPWFSIFISFWWMLQLYVFLDLNDVICSNMKHHKCQVHPVLEILGHMITRNIWCICNSFLILLWAF